MATFDLGRVTPLYKGDYSASASYELNDVVLYNGNLYWHVQATATVGILPTDTTVWKLTFADEGVRAEIRGYADDAQVSKTAAAQSASQASASASNASASASQAASSAQAAQTAETGATASAQTASTKASEASTSAQSAASSAQTATDKATLATNKAQAASESASLATAKASAAATSETNAVTAAQTATTKASEASQSASTATTKASEAAVSANTATTAKTDAETARDAAAQSASEAAASAESIDPDEFDRKIYAAFATDTASGAIAHFTDGADSIPMKDVLVHIEPVQEGSGDPSLDNVRPITGWTGAKVTRTGKNLLPNTPKRDSQGTMYFSVDSTTKKLDINGTNSSTTYTSGGITQQNARYSLRAGTYTISVDQFPTNTTDSYLNMEMFTADGTRTQKTIYGNSADRYLTFTIGSDVVFDWWMSIVSGTYDHFLCGIQLEVGSTATSYEPYSGQTYDITFPTEAGTVYGGTLDVTTGRLIVDKAILTKNTATMDNDESYPGWRNSGIRALIGEGLNQEFSNQILNIGTKFSVKTTSSNDTLYLYIPTYGKNQTEWKALAQDVQICCSLAEPIIYQLTPQEITSLLGQNNVWANTGDTEVEYRADTKLYISRLTEPDADMVADANIVSGQYFMVGNNLYRATANIASGASVIVGTNATKVSLAQALNAINQ